MLFYYNNQDINIEYDDAGNRTRVAWDNDSREINYNYGLMNELLNLTGPEGTSSFTYDSLGRELKRSLANGTSVATGYYTNGQTKSIVTRNPAQEIIDSVGYV